MQLVDCIEQFLDYLLDAWSQLIDYARCESFVHQAPQSSVGWRIRRIISKLKPSITGRVAKQTSADNPTKRSASNLAREGKPLFAKARMSS